MTLTNSKVDYYTTTQDGKFQLYLKVATDFGGPIHNFVAEKDSQEEIDGLLRRLKSLSM